MGDMDQIREQRVRAQLEAIEARLAEHAEVAGAVAIVRDEKLIAYVVSRSGELLTDEALRGHLKTALPAYMIPRHFVALDALPLAQDGAVDRDALPEPQSGVPAAPVMATAKAVEGRDSRTDYLIGVWSQLLGKEVGANDNFFDLGGHSMLAVQMANRVKVDTGVRIQLMTLATQTLAQIASELPVATAKTAPAGLSTRLVGGLKGMLRGTAKQP